MSVSSAVDVRHCGYVNIYLLLFQDDPNVVRIICSKLLRIESVQVWKQLWHIAVSLRRTAQSVDYSTTFTILYGLQRLF